MINPRLPFIRSCIFAVLHSSLTLSSPAKAGDAVIRSVAMTDESRGVLDVPLEPVIGIAEGETRWRGMTKIKSHASIRLNTSVAFVPPNPKEFESTVPSFALSMRLRTIGTSANTGSSSVMWALSQMKPFCIISSE